MLMSKCKYNQCLRARCKRALLLLWLVSPSVDLLDVKTLGCVKTEECSAETSLELYPNATLYTMTKHCCDTAFCNAARPARPVGLCSYLTGPALGLWYLTGPPPALH